MPNDRYSLSPSALSPFALSQVFLYLTAYEVDNAALVHQAWWRCSQSWWRSSIENVRKFEKVGTCEEYFEDNQLGHGFEFGSFSEDGRYFFFKMYCDVPDGPQEDELFVYDLRACKRVLRTRYGGADQFMESRLGRLRRDGTYLSIADPMADGRPGRRAQLLERRLMCAAAPSPKFIAPGAFGTALADPEGGTGGMLALWPDAC
ncbi:unnamed protein product, partial [Heterosigma akashiwo]